MSFKQILLVLSGVLVLIALGVAIFLQISQFTSPTQEDIAVHSLGPVGLPGFLRVACVIPGCEVHVYLTCGDVQAADKFTKNPDGIFVSEAEARSSGWLEVQARWFAPFHPFDSEWVGGALVQIQDSSGVYLRTSPVDHPWTDPTTPNYALNIEGMEKK